MIHRSRFPNFISRSETKLKLSSEQAEALLHEVERYLPTYCYAPGRAITFVSSVYYDTEDFLFYNRAKLFPHDNLKVRLKEYYYQVDAGYEIFQHCWIEVKRRLGECTTKLRFRIPKDLVTRLFTAEDLYGEIVPSNGFMDVADLRRIYDEFLQVVRGRVLLAHSVTNYRRRTFQKGGDESIRITFDDRIAYFRSPASLFNGANALTRERLGTPAAMQSHAVVEIKVACEAPDWLTDLLRRYPHTNFSKFLTSTQTLLLPRSAAYRPAEARMAQEGQQSATGAAWTPLERIGRDPFVRADGDAATDA